MFSLNNMQGVGIELAGSEPDGTADAWRRVAHKLRGEALSFRGAVAGQAFDAVLLGTTDDGLLLFDPERREDGLVLEPFERIVAVTPLPKSRAGELRAAYERSAAAR